MAGLLGAFRQYIRDAMPGGALNPEVTRQGLLDAGAIATTPVPLLGDAVGLLADANRYINEPESRTPMNFGLSALGALPFVPHMGMAGIFAGQGAKTADLVKLEKAKSLDASGVPNKEIWQQTGWFKGPEGKWKFEIDDSNSIPLGRSWGELEDLKHGNTTVTPRQSALAHPNLSAAYPESKRVGVVLSPTMKDGGSFTNDPAAFGATIRVGADPKYNGKANRSTMLHELQHYVQDKEGFARGGTPENAPIPLWDEIVAVREEKRQLNVDPYKIQNKLSGGYRVTPDELGGLKKWEALTAKEDALLAKSREVGPYEMYRRLAGEAESRAVQSRMNMTPQQRSLLFPLDSYDVPLDQLIFR